MVSTPPIEATVDIDPGSRRAEAAIAETIAGRSSFNDVVESPSVSTALAIAQEELLRQLQVLEDPEYSAERSVIVALVGVVAQVRRLVDSATSDLVYRSDAAVALLDEARLVAEATFSVEADVDDPDDSAAFVVGEASARVARAHAWFADAAEKAVRS